MIIFSLFAVITILTIAAMILIYNLIIKKSSSDRTKGIFRLIMAIILSIAAGGVGFFLSFAIGEGLMEGLNEKIAILMTFAGVSIYNFVVCLFIGRFYPKSIWFAWFITNIIVWVVIITSPREPGGFVDLWWGWTALVIFAFIGSVVGLLLSRKEPKQLDTAKKE
jgi:hypothetical protein